MDKTRKVGVDLRFEGDEPLCPALYNLLLLLRQPREISRIGLRAFRRQGPAGVTRSPASRGRWSLPSSCRNYAWRYRHERAAWGAARGDGARAAAKRARRHLLSSMKLTGTSPRMGADPDGLSRDVEFLKRGVRRTDILLGLMRSQEAAGQMGRDKVTWMAARLTNGRAEPRLIEIA